MASFALKEKEKERRNEEGLKKEGALEKVLKKGVVAERTMGWFSYTKAGNPAAK